jgi:hypothetical protein
MLLFMLRPTPKRQPPACRGCLLTRSLLASPPRDCVRSALADKWIFPLRLPSIPPRFQLRLTSQVEKYLGFLVTLTSRLLAAPLPNKYSALLFSPRASILAPSKLIDVDKKLQRVDFIILLRTSIG